METTHYIIIGVLILMLIALVYDKFRPSYTFLLAVFVLVVMGIVPSNRFLESLSDKAIISIFLLIIITAGIENHFQLGTYFQKVFGKSNKPWVFMLRFGSLVTGLSSVMNNTPVVAMFIPYIHEWSKKNRFSSSKFLMPLSFFAIAGGMITVIGTSTNLVLKGLVEKNTEYTLNSVDFLIPGLGVALFTLLYVAFLGYKWLPARKDLMEMFAENSREYLIETAILEGSRLIGKTVEEAGLRNLQGVFLAEIFRDGRLIAPVKPNEALQVNDLLFFAGDTDQVLHLLRESNGLEISKKVKLDLHNHQELVEAVIPYNSLLSGSTVKEFGFRERYDAAIVGIHRRGEKLSGKIGDRILETGDLLLLTAGPDFRKLVQQDSNLYIVSSHPAPSTTPTWKKRTFLFALLAIVFLAALPATSLGFDRNGGLLRLHEALFLILGMQFALGMMDSAVVKRNVSLDLLIILASALTIGAALVESGTSVLLADGFIQLMQGKGSLTIGIGLFVLTVILTQFITNVAAVSIVFPIALSLGDSLGINPVAFFMIAAFGASASFITPMSYQTNLMVYGPGGYKFNDFVKLGLPLTLFYGLIALTYFAIKYNLKW